MKRYLVKFEGTDWSWHETYEAAADAAEDLGNEYPHINCSVVFVSSDESESGNAN